MDNCLFSSAGNNPELSIFNTTSTFYYVGQYIPIFSPGGVVCEITNGGKNGLLLSLSQANLIREKADSWCASYGAGWKLPSIQNLQTIYDNKTLINSTLAVQGYTILIDQCYWSREHELYKPDYFRRWYFVSLNNGYSNYVSVKVSASNIIKYPSTETYYVRAVYTF